ncbi:helix-turn-helix domain-containing protein [Labilibacter sediminis]|nr:helix-turn-helix domain-containing protein [Labilibacter sediminis]
MKQRLQTLLATEKIASSKFADILGVNRSSISHLLSGRNNPSLDFLQKVLVNFPHINPDWLLLGQGAMFRNDVEDKNIPVVNQIPFEDKHEEKEVNKEEIKPVSIPPEKIITETEKMPKSEAKEDEKVVVSPVNAQKKIERIVFFYSDQSFDTYFPNK